ncbi:hypothetical protein ACO0RG_001591 [Hanseniaspora osmophila]
MTNQAKSYAHLYSDEANARKPSPLKTCIHYFNDPNIVFLGGGLPMSTYFPWQSISAVSPKAPFVNGIGAPCTSSEDSIEYTIPKNISDTKGKDVIALERCLQYGFSQGQTPFLDFVREHTKIVHQMGKYEDWDVLATTGNTGAWESTLRVFCNRGDTILAEAHSFSSSIAAAEAQGINTFPVPMDNEGIIPEKLSEILDNWTEGVPKPKLLYTIPTGQNPTGSSLSVERKVAIYELAKKHDFIIIEDEPYYFLQTGEYVPADKRAPVTKAASHKEFLDNLSTSFISLDTEGRVIRMDSFSKVLAPGTRLGWLVGAKSILNTYLKFHEMSIQAPAGFTQTLVSETLHQWGQDGYLDWLIGLRYEYTLKRDFCIDSLKKHLPLDLMCKSDPTKPVIAINPPNAGMFFIVTVEAAEHPEFETKFGKDTKKVEEHVYEQIIANGALLVPGMWFEANGDTEPAQPKSSKTANTSTQVFFRGTFAAVPLEKLDKGVARVGEVMVKEFTQK